MIRLLVLVCLLSLNVFAMPHVPRNIQAPYVAADFWTQWGSNTPRMALFIKVTPQSFWTGASAIGFTSNTRNMTLPGHPGITFYSAPGVTPTLADQILGETSSVDFQGIYQTGIFERSDVIAGKWNFAEIEVFSACWDNTNLGELVHAKGNLGEFKDYQTYFTAEGRGLLGRLSREVDESTQRLCRVREFGDTRCGKDLTTTVTLGGVAYKIRQTGVTGIGSTSGTDYPGAVIVFDTSTFSGNVPANSAALGYYCPRFKNGTLKATSGPNAGISREIAAAAESTGGHPYINVYLKRAFPFTVDVNTTFTLTMGCVRTIEDCRTFANAARFNGEPFVPNIENVNRITSAN